MLEAGGATVRVAGFHRRPLSADPDATILPLGLTRDAALAHRLSAVGRWLLRPAALRRTVQGADLVIARNLEMLLLAYVALIGRRRIPLHYECLDLHRLMLGRGMVSGMLRTLEALLMRRVTRVIISSPAFERHYFRVYHSGADCLLIENRVLALDGRVPSPEPIKQQGPPWIIGWFGMIRCRRSLEILAALAAAADGAVRVIIRGRPSAAVFPDLAAEVADLPDVSFQGAYSADDLGRLYGEVHFVWAIDYYEEGLNSAWLLPNRLYEGGAFNRPAIAQDGVETARWLKTHHTGLILSDPAEALGAWMRTLTPSRYDEMVVSVRAIPRADLICDRDACITFVQQLHDPPV